MKMCQINLLKEYFPHRRFKIVHVGRNYNTTLLGKVQCVCVVAREIFLADAYYTTVNSNLSIIFTFSANEIVWSTTEPMKHRGGEYLKVIPPGCKFDSPSYIINKVLELMLDEFAARIVSRQIALLNEYFKYSPNGMMLKDLPTVYRVLKYMISKYSTFPEYKDCLVKLLELCCKSPLISESDDVASFLPVLAQLFSLLGYSIVLLHDGEIKKRVFHAIHSLIAPHGEAENNRVSLCFIHSGVELSDLPRTLGELLELSDEEMYLALLRVIQLLIAISEQIIQKVIQSGAIEGILRKLDPYCTERDEIQPLPEPRAIIRETGSQEVEDIEVGVLWTLLLYLKKNPPNGNIFTPSRRALWSLRYAFRISIWNLMIEQRNCYMGLISLILNVFPNLEIVECGLAKDIIELSADKQSSAYNMLSMQLTNTFEDFEFKKLLLLSLCYLAKYRSSIGIMKENSIIRMLLDLIYPREEGIPWTMSQMWELIVYAFRVLSFLAPKFASEFIKHKATKTFINLLINYISKPCGMQIVYSCLNAIIELIVHGGQLFIAKLVSNNGVCCVIGLCNHFLNRQSLSSEDLKAMSYSFIILEKMFLNNTKVQMEYGPESVKLVMRTFKRILEKRSSDSPLTDKLLMCALDFMWEAIVWCDSNLKRFITEGGVYLVLDLIEESISAVQLIALGALVDMCDEGMCVPHIVTWRGGEKKNIIYSQLLAQIWRNEEAVLGVKRTKDGCIADIEMPLMGTEQQKLTYDANFQHSSPAIIDIMVSLRPKIYAILTLLRYRHHERVEIVEQKYRITFLPMPARDQITLALANNYLPLKIGEIWTELAFDVGHAGLKLMADDGFVLQRFCKEQRNWSLGVHTKQMLILHSDIEKQKKTKEDVANLAKDCKRTSELDALHRLQEFVCATDKEFKKWLKERERDKIDQSLQFPPWHDKKRCHRTYLPNEDKIYMEGETVDIGGDVMMDAMGETSSNFNF